MIINKNEILNFSNLLSILRLLLSIPLFLLFFYWNEPGIADIIIILVLFASLTDILDGYLARKLNQITEFGKIIDPLADKIAMSAVLLGFLFNELLSTYYILIVITRDIIIFLGGIYIAKRTNYVLPSNWIGKLTVFIIGLVILLRLFNLKEGILIFDIIFYLSLLMIFMSIIVYSIRGIKVLKEGQ